MARPELLGSTTELLGQFAGSNVASNSFQGENLGDFQPSGALAAVNRGFEISITSRNMLGNVQVTLTQRCHPIHEQQ